MPYEFPTRNRPDLARDVHPEMQKGLLQELIFPTNPVPVITNANAPYQVPVADNTSTTRTDTNTAITRTEVTSHTFPYTCVEKVTGKYITKSQTKLYGGVRRAEVRLTKSVKRTLLKDTEKTVATLILQPGVNPTGSNNVFALEDDFLLQIEKAKEKLLLSQVVGETCLVMSHTVASAIYRLPEVIEKMSVTGVIGKNARIVRGVNAQVLQDVLDVRVEIGLDTYWGTPANAGFAHRCALVVLPSPIINSQEEDVVFGKKFQFLPDGTQPFEVDTVYDRKDKKQNLLDVIVWRQIKILNPEGLITFSNVKER